MRKGLVGVAVLIWAAGVTGLGESVKEVKPETLARWHFAGTRQLANSKDLTTVREILALKESEELRRVAAEGFAAQMAARFTKTTDTNANAQLSALIKPLLPDVVENESWFDLTARGADDADWYLALKLPGDRIAQWNKNLAELANAAHMQVSKAEKGESWSAQRDNYRLSVMPSKEWLILQGGIGRGENKPRKAPKSGGKEVLTAEINGPAIAKLWSPERFQHSPKLSLTVLPRKGTLRSEMQIDYPQSLNITPEKWQVPTDLIRDPLVGFTAVQGIGPTLAKNPQARQLGMQKVPNQAFFWSQGTMAFTIFGAADVGNPATVISNLAAHPPAIMKDAMGAMTVLTNRPGILWRGLPVVVPFVEAAADGKSPYLEAGLFPVSSEKAKPAPPELFAQLNKKNLVYYDWEITQERLKQWRPVWQFAQIIQGKMFPASASDRWIEAITPKLENTITEVTLEEPSRLKLVRQSQAGFTALELVLLAHAVDPYDVANRPPHNPNAPRPARKNPTLPKH